MVAPALMLQLNANVDLEFDDFEEIENHPMAQAFMVTFDQLLESAYMSREEINATELNEIEIDAENDNEE